MSKADIESLRELVRNLAVSVEDLTTELELVKKDLAEVKAALRR